MQLFVTVVLWTRAFDYDCITDYVVCVYYVVFMTILIMIVLWIMTVLIMRRLTMIAVCVVMYYGL